MKLILKILLLLIVFSFTKVKSQTEIENIQSNDSITIIKKSIIPVSLIGIGLILNNSDFEHEFQANLRNRVGNNYEFRFDDFLQYVPIVEIYTADALGIKAKNHWFDQTKYLLISNLCTSLITHGLKEVTHKVRPDGSLQSFPSGHTSFAFTNATVLYNEFKDSSSVLALSGFGFASTTGAFRMVNNKHWLSDVLVGAGLGIIIAELVYYFEPLKNFNPVKKIKNITLIPQIDINNYCVYFAYRF